MLRLALLAFALATPAAAEPPPPPRPAAATEAGAGRGMAPVPRPVPLSRPPLPDVAGAAGVCDDPRLAATVVEPVIGEGECGILQPVRLAAAAGVALDPPPLVTCDTARSLATWLQRGPKVTFAARGTRLERLAVVDAYSCRNRNRAADGKLSEHAFGRAIDISAFVLADGATVTVLDGWRDRGWSAALRHVHDAACGPFSTVLGPDANPLHADHFHLDTARRRSPYCE